MISCLYIDDDPGLLEIAKEFLELANDLRIIIHEDPRDAVKILEEGNIDIIVSDYQMPDINGIELFDLIRAAGFDMPFILFTGKGREEVAIKALNAGIDFYLTKGGSPSAQFAELENIIRQLARRSGAEGALSYNAKRFKMIIENVPGIVLIADNAGTIKYASPYVKQFLNYESEEMVGANAFSFLHPSDDYLKGLDDPNSILDDTATYQFRLKFKGGEFKWFEGTRKPMPIEFGEGVFVVSAWLIDDRKKLELDNLNKERILRAVFDNSNEYMLIVSGDGTIKDANRKLCESSGYTENELIGSSVQDMVAPSNLELLNSMIAIKANNNHEKTTYRLTVRDKVGNDRKVSISSQRVDNPGKDPFIIVTGLEDRALDDTYCEMLGTNEYIGLVVGEAQNIIVGMDRAGHINIFNKRAEKFFDIPVSFAKGKDLRDLFKGNSRYVEVLRDTISGMDRYVEEGVVSEQPFLISIKDISGNPRKIVWQRNKLMKGDYCCGVVLSGMDITDVNVHQ